MMGPLVRLAAAFDIALNIAREAGAIHSPQVIQSGLAQFGLLVGVAYILHETAGGTAAVAAYVRKWWKIRR